MTVTYEPDWAVHPGEILQETLEERGMTQTELAIRLGWTLKHINRICRGHVGISPALAVDLETVLDIPARFWLNLQSAYDLQRARER